MRETGRTVARLLIALALIVQIVAPVRSAVAMVTAAADPLVAIVVCGEDLAVLDRQNHRDPLLTHRGDACAFCRLVAGDGFAPPPTARNLADPITRTRAADWTLEVEPIAIARLLDHIRGRAPPIFS